VLTTNQKGAVAEAKVAVAALELGVSPTRNNQKRRIRWAEDLSFAAKLGARGAVAQLGERGAGSAQVTGSSPVGSTNEAASSRRLPLF
jgi:hypothetical protein